METSANANTLEQFEKFTLITECSFKIETGDIENTERNLYSKRRSTSEYIEIQNNILAVRFIYIPSPSKINKSNILLFPLSNFT